MFKYIELSNVIVCQGKGHTDTHKGPGTEWMNLGQIQAPKCCALNASLNTVTVTSSHCYPENISWFKNNIMDSSEYNDTSIKCHRLYLKKERKEYPSLEGKSLINYIFVYNMFKLILFMSTSLSLSIEMITSLLCV